jgi:hypothetical protein
MFIADSLVTGRDEAMRRSGQHKGKNYNRVFGEWMSNRPWVRELDNPTRTSVLVPRPSVGNRGMARHAGLERARSP